ncbi:MAG TPA: hypothetical protein PLF16_00215 [Candidatus Staskawiczbacteria bacterium]|nr:hypothetical protein [Candidatus Staskawiczbacteria bacterium]
MSLKLGIIALVIGDELAHLGFHLFENTGHSLQFNRGGLAALHVAVERKLASVVCKLREVCFVLLCLLPHGKQAISLFGFLRG